MCMNVLLSFLMDSYQNFEKKLLKSLKLDIFDFIIFKILLQNASLSVSIY